MQSLSVFYLVISTESRAVLGNQQIYFCGRYRKPEDPLPKGAKEFQPNLIMNKIRCAGGGAGDVNKN